MPLVEHNNVELVGFLREITVGDEKPANLQAGLILADWLDEREDPRAADVREIAETRSVVPVVAEEYPDINRPSIIVACGSKWSVVQNTAGVFARVEPWSPLYSLCDPIKMDRFWKVDENPPERQVILEAHADQLAALIAAIFGYRAFYDGPAFVWDDQDGEFNLGEFNGRLRAAYNVSEPAAALIGHAG